MIFIVGFDPPEPQTWNEPAHRGQEKAVGGILGRPPALARPLAFILWTVQRSISWPPSAQSVCGLMKQCYAARAARRVGLRALFLANSCLGRIRYRVVCVALTLLPHAHLEALSQAAVLALVAVVLVDRAAPGAAALVRQVPPHGPLEEALAACKTMSYLRPRKRFISHEKFQEGERWHSDGHLSTFAGELAVVLPARLVPADDAADLLPVLVLDHRVAAAGVAPDAALAERRVRDARGDVGRAGNPEGYSKNCRARVRGHHS